MSQIPFTILQKIPQGLLTIPATHLHEVLPGPTLIDLPGKSDSPTSRAPVFLSCLIHGNETTGLLVIQELLKKYGETGWPRPAFLFFGNVKAAAQGRRHLDDQPDFNRIWNDGHGTLWPYEHQMAAAVLKHVNPSRLFAAIDIHNNTGRNPHYVAINSLDATLLNLAALFGELCLYDAIPLGTCSEGFAKHCLALTIEAGQPGKSEGTEHVLEFIEKLLVLEKIPEKPVATLGLKIMEIIGAIKIPQEADFVFDPDLDLLNFTLVKPGTDFGQCLSAHRFVVKNDQGVDVSNTYFAYENFVIKTRQAFIPSMLTLDPIIMKSDCLGYVMREKV